MSRLSTILFIALLAGSVVVGAIVVDARSPDLEIQVIHLDRKFSPNGDRRHDFGRIAFYVRESEPDATVEIVGPFLKETRILYTGALRANQRVSFTWNGRTDSGAPADPRNRYRLRVILPSRDRDMVYPRPISLNVHGSG